MSECVCVCVCVRERERERERDSSRPSDSLFVSLCCQSSDGIGNERMAPESGAPEAAQEASLSGCICAAADHKDV